MKIARWLSLGVGLLGCNGHVKPAALPPPAPAQAAPQEDRTPYAEVAAPLRAPVELDGVWLRLQSATELWRKLPRLAQSLPGLTVLRMLSSTQHLPPDVAAVVDLSQPIDVVAPLPSFLQTTWAYRVRSPEAILRGTAGLTLRRVDAGVWDIGGVTAVAEGSNPSEDDSEWEGGIREVPDLRCRLLHLPPPVGFRVVCGRDYQKLAASVDFLVSPARELSTDADLHFELSGPTYDEFKGQRLLAMALAQPAGASAGERGALLVADLAKAFYAHRRASFDVSLRGSSARAEVELVYPASLESARFTEWLEHASRAALPSSSTALPRESGLGLSFSGTGERGLRYLLSELQASVSDDCVVSPAQLAEMDAALSGVLPPDGKVSFAYGLDTEVAHDALDDAARRLADETERPLAPATVKKLQAALGGWMVLGLDVSPERFLPAARRVHRASQVKLPLKPGKTEGDADSSSQTKLVAAPSGLPTGTLHFVEQTRPKANVRKAEAAATLPFDRHYLLVPERNRVWVVITRSESVALARARALLAARGSLEWPNLAEGERAALLGTVDLRTIVALGLDWDSREQRADAVAALARLSQASRRGAARVPLRVDVLRRPEPEGGYRLRVETEVDLQELVVEALALVPPEPEPEEE